MTIAAPTLFAFRHDWGAPFRVTRSWQTDVQVANDGTEVRAQLRSSAAVACTFRALFRTEFGAGRLLATWRGAPQPLRYYVPMWCDASDLTAAVTAGDSTIACDTTDRPLFVDAGYAMLYRENVDAVDTSELVTIDTVSAASFTITGTAANDYAVAGTRVVPCRVMWLTLPVQVTWLSSQIFQADLTFTDEGAQAGYQLSGTDTTATEDSLVIYADAYNRTGNGQTGAVPYTLFVEATVKDVLGIPLPSKAVTWTSTVTSGTSITVTPAVNSRFARVYVDAAGGSITATCGAVSATIGVN